MRDKPVYAWPFILVYRVVVKIPLMLIYYFFSGFTVICYGWWKLVKYFVMGVSFPFVVIGRAIKGDKPSKKELKAKETKFNKENEEKEKNIINEIAAETLAVNNVVEPIINNEVTANTIDSSSIFETVPEMIPVEQPINENTVVVDNNVNNNNVNNNNVMQDSSANYVPTIAESNNEPVLTVQNVTPEITNVVPEITNTAIVTSNVEPVIPEVSNPVSIEAAVPDIPNMSLADAIAKANSNDNFMDTSMAADIGSDDLSSIPTVDMDPNKPLTKREQKRLAKEKKKIELLNKQQEEVEEHRKHNESIMKVNLAKFKERQAKLEQEKEAKNAELEAALHPNGNGASVTPELKKKKKVGDYINDFLESFIHIETQNEKNAKNEARKKESMLARNKRNRQELEREAIVLDFDGEDAKKSEKKVVYEYEAKDPDGNFVKGYFNAFSKVEVHSFLLSEGYVVYSIKTNQLIQMLHGSQEAKGVKFKTKDLIFFLTQLSTYVKAGIPLVDSLKILSRQFPQKGYQKVFRAMIYDLTMGDSFSNAMEKQNGAFPKILSNMVKTSEMTGELPEILDDMQVYFEESDKTKKQMITALTYPIIVFVLATAALVFIMVYIVPQFVQIYAGMDNAQLPGITVFILNLSNFIQTKWMYIVAVVAIVIFVFTYLYKNVKLFKTGIQWLLMHVPIIGNVIIYNEVTMFTKTFASLLKHNVFITDTMDILNKITDNEIWKMIILDTITNLSKGEKISLAFKGHWAVPIPAYEMIVTGERTGQLPEMMQKVSDYYQELHKNQVGRIKSFVEPILILGLTGAVGVIVLSIVIPMFDMYQQLS